MNGSSLDPRPGDGGTLPELDELESLIGALGALVRVEVLQRVASRAGSYPIYGLSLGTTEPRAPTFAMVGGVHGLERIGTQVVLAYLTVLARALEWDQLLLDSLARMRLVFVPLVNPGGMAERKRSNPRGVDLMRNGPPQTHGTGSWLIGGQSLSPILPWYAGRERGEMEPESQALCDFVTRNVLVSEASILIDVHSGFGAVDRLWFPYARTRRPFVRLAEVYRLGAMLDRTLPNHPYRIEPQAHAYTIQGDLWDHLCEISATAYPEHTFVPWTLEMGSWLWLKKNPRQIFDSLGTFNPMAPHRLRRILRRHLSLFDLLRRAAAGPGAWVAADAAARRAYEREAFSRWYGR